MGHEQQQWGLTSTDEKYIDTLLRAYHKAPPGKNGDKAREKALKALISMATQKSRRTLQEEKVRVAEEARAGGFESLTTDTKGARSRQWFEETGLAFSAGWATRCIAVAVWHPDIGMGAAHRNTFSLKDFERVIRARLKEQNPLALISALSSRPDTPEASFKAHLQTAVNDAFYQFEGLFRQGGITTFPSQGTDILWIGCDFLDPAKQALYNQFIQGEVIPSIPLLHDGRAKLTGRNITLSPHLGKAGAIITGGPNHPLYPGPCILT